MYLYKLTVLEGKLYMPYKIHLEVVCESFDSLSLYNIEIFCPLDRLQFTLCPHCLPCAMKLVEWVVISSKGKFPDIHAHTHTLSLSLSLSLSLNYPILAYVCSSISYTRVYLF